MGKLFTITLATFSALGSLLFGYDSGVMTDVIASKSFLDFFGTDAYSPVLGAIVSTFAAGACVGALAGGFTMDRFGRRRTIQLGAIICIIGGTLQAAAAHLAMMLIGRIVTGWAVGIMSMAVPVYQAELAHPKDRGLMVGLSQQMIGIGFIISTWIGYGSAHAPDTSSFQWRFPLAFQVIPAVALAVGLQWFPESPRQLIEKSQPEKAYATLRKLHADGTNDEWIEREFEEIRNTIWREKEKGVDGGGDDDDDDDTVNGWWVMVKDPVLRKRLALGVGVQVFTQLTGINVINYYQTTMYAALGFEGKTGLLVTGFYNFVGPITNLIFITLIIDRIGRKTPLILGTIAITLLLLLEAILNSQQQQKTGGSETNTNKALSRAGVAVIFLVSAAFSMSFGPVSWVYMSEIMPMRIRGRGNAVAAGVGNWGVNVLFSQVSPQGLKKLSWKYYFVFAAFNTFITLPIIILFFKETKGLSLEEIDGLFAPPPPDPPAGAPAAAAAPPSRDRPQIVEIGKATDQNTS